VNEISLREYQQDIINKMVATKTGRHIIKAATGLGKTVIMTQYPHRGRQMVIVNRDELVQQTVEKFNDGRTVGVEKAELHSNGQEDVVVASIQSLHRRLDNYAPADFADIHVDECHYAAARTYHKTLDYFKPIATWGYSATPSRNDSVRLDDLFDDVLVDYDIEWGINNGWLCDIRCRQVNLGIDLSNVKRSGDDFNLLQLDEAMDNTSEAIAEVYEKYHVGSTLIFTASVKKAYEIADLIKGAKVIEANTKLDDRRRWVNEFKAGQIPVLASMGTLTTGFDSPNIETIILARPSTNNGLVTQMIGRGTRTHPGKKCLHLIDCTQSIGQVDICAPACIIGYDMPAVARKRMKSEEEYSIFNVPKVSEKLANTPETWIKSIKDVDIFKRKHKLNTHQINFRKLPDGSLKVNSAPKCFYLVPPISSLGTVFLPGVGEIKAQQAIDMLFTHLKAYHYETRALWNKNTAARWGNNPATLKQMNMINRWVAGGKIDFSGVDLGKLTAAEASAIIDSIIS
jgi:hypothetical protein